MYADDIVLLAPSAVGLQSLLNSCDNYGQDHDILFNPSKSKVMFFDTLNVGVNPNFMLSNSLLMYAQSYVYLGHIICNTLSDDQDMCSKQRSLYARSNLLEIVISVLVIYGLLWKYLSL